MPPAHSKEANGGDEEKNWCILCKQFEGDVDKELTLFAFLPKQVCLDTPAQPYPLMRLAKFHILLRYIGVGFRAVSLNPSRELTIL